MTITLTDLEINNNGELTKAGLILCRIPCKGIDVKGYESRTMQRLYTKTSEGFNYKSHWVVGEVDNYHYDFHTLFGWYKNGDIQDYRSNQKVKSAEIVTEVELFPMLKGKDVLKVFGKDALELLNAQSFKKNLELISDDPTAFAKNIVI